MATASTPDFPRVLRAAASQTLSFPSFMKHEMISFHRIEFLSFNLLGRSTIIGVSAHTILL
jgi:hypothetical protein